MTGRGWLRSPAKEIRAPVCPTGRERFRDQSAARLAIDTFNTHTATTPCPECGGWHHAQRPPQPPPADVCEPNWRTNPVALDRLCEIGAREFHGNTATYGRDIDTVPLQGDLL